MALMRHLSAGAWLPQLQAVIVQAPPGMPVGQLVAHQSQALGFQQTSELLHGARHTHRGRYA